MIAHLASLPNCDGGVTTSLYDIEHFCPNCFDVPLDVYSVSQKIPPED